MLSLVSPVWKAKLCRADWSLQSSARCLHLESEARTSFDFVLDLVCGREVLSGGIKELISLGQFADMYGIDVVCQAIEDTVLRHLAIDSCAEAVIEAQTGGLSRLEASCLDLALADFERFAGAEGFVRMDEATVGSLLGSDLLQASGEERVFEAAARWMRLGQGRAERGSGLLSKIRFGLMERGYLQSLLTLHENSKGGCGCIVRELVAEALASRMTDSEALIPRAHKQVAWGEYLGGGGRNAARRMRAASEAFAVAVCGGRVWSGGWDGRLRAWSAETLEEEQTVRGHRQAVCALAAGGGRVVSGCGDGGMKVWDGATGRCVGGVEGGHVGGINALLVRLVSFFL